MSQEASGRSGTGEHASGRIWGADRARCRTAGRPRSRPPCGRRSPGSAAWSGTSRSGPMSGDQVTWRLPPSTRVLDEHGGSSFPTIASVSTTSRDLYEHSVGHELDGVGGEPARDGSAPDDQTELHVLVHTVTWAPNRQNQISIRIRRYSLPVTARLHWACLASCSARRSTCVRSAATGPARSIVCTCTSTPELRMTCVRGSSSPAV
jgi:hypothetical protein